MRIAQLQISYCKLEIKINAKIEVFFVYIILLNNKETFENSRINTRSSIAIVYRNLILLNLFSINILYCFKATINFSYIFDVKNAILDCAS